MIDIFDIRFQLTSSIGLYLSFLFLYFYIKFSLYVCYSTNLIFFQSFYFFICYPILKYILLIILSRHITKTILFNF